MLDIFFDYLMNNLKLLFRFTRRNNRLIKANTLCERRLSNKSEEELEFGGYK